MNCGQRHDSTVDEVPLLVYPKTVDTTEIKLCACILNVIFILVLGATAVCPTGCDGPSSDVDHTGPTNTLDGQITTRTGPQGWRPNVMLIMIDTLRADCLGCYGHSRSLTPTMDEIAAESVVFENAIAQAPWTQPSVAALFTGMYPGSIIPITNYRLTFDAIRGSAKSVRVLQEHHLTLAEVMRAGGYATAAINTNVYIVDQFGFAQGFDYFEFLRPKAVSKPVTGKTVNEVAIQWLADRDSEKPFFLYLHYMDVHGPYNAGPKFLDPLLEIVDARHNNKRLTTQQLQDLNPRYLLRMPNEYTNPARHERLWEYREYWEARYEAGVAEMDYHLGMLRDDLIKMKLWDDLIVILVADHGEGLGQIGYFGHGHSLTHTELHVPLIMRAPGALPAGQRFEHTVRVMDIMPTIMELFELSQPNPTMQGRSLLPLIEGTMSSSDSVTSLCEGLKYHRTGLRTEPASFYSDDWKVRVIDDKSALFRYRKDPLEQTYLNDWHPQILASLVEGIHAQRAENARHAAGAVPKRIPLTPEQIRHLRSLGYIADEGDYEDVAGE